METNFFGKQATEEELNYTPESEGLNIPWLEIDPKSQPNKTRSLALRFVRNVYTGAMTLPTIHRQSYSTVIDGDDFYMFIPPKGTKLSEKFIERYTVSKKIYQIRKKYASKGHEHAMALVGNKELKVDSHIKWKSQEVAVVQVVEDEQVPKNVGKYFFWGIPQDVQSKIHAVINPTEQARKRGKKAVDVWNVFDAPVFYVTSTVSSKTYTSNGEVKNSRDFSTSEFDLERTMSVLLAGKEVKFTPKELEGATKGQFTDSMKKIIAEYEASVKEPSVQMIFDEDKFDWDKHDKMVDYINRVMRKEIPTDDLGIGYDMLSSSSLSENKKLAKPKPPKQDVNDGNDDTADGSEYDDIMDDDEF